MVSKSKRVAPRSFQKSNSDVVKNLIYKRPYAIRFKYPKIFIESPLCARNCWVQKQNMKIPSLVNIILLTSKINEKCMRLQTVARKTTLGCISGMPGRELGGSEFYTFRVVPGDLPGGALLLSHGIEAMVPAPSVP